MFWRRDGRGLRPGRLTDFERIDPDRLGDVLELGLAEIADGEIESSLHLPIGLLGETNRSRLGGAFQTRGDIDALAHQVAVSLLDDVAEMDADAELDAAIFRQAGVALDHASLKLDRAAHRVDHASKFGEEPIAGALDDAPTVRCDRGINQIAAQASEARQRSVFVSRG
jgi:hypothetical protein